MSAILKPERRIEENEVAEGDILFSFRKARNDLRALREFLLRMPRSTVQQEGFVNSGERVLQKLGRRIANFERRLNQEIAERDRCLHIWGLGSGNAHEIGVRHQAFEAALIRRTANALSSAGILEDLVAQIVSEPQAFWASPGILTLLECLLANADQLLTAIEEFRPKICLSAFFYGLQMQWEKMHWRIREGKKRLSWARSSRRSSPESS